eukprot:TRINITY_DN6966_c0_g1_i1.p1 TRINITY_DN6966_c0_g1~~TRINITY_DN6966_c0_g1_i1.p1  ORF type:complete len:202 (+),score=49.48 TRINITY_DN6966_c0_g1_i1:78-683(+)
MCIRDSFTHCVNPTTHLPLGGFQESSVQFSFGFNAGVKGCDTRPGCNLQMFAFTNNILGGVGLSSVGALHKKTDMQFMAQSASGSASVGSGGLGMNASWTAAGDWIPASSMSGDDWAAMYDVKLKNEMCCKKGLFGKEKCDCSAQTYFSDSTQIRRLKGTTSIGPLFVAEVPEMVDQLVDFDAPGVLAFQAQTVYSAGLSC